MTAEVGGKVSDGTLEREKWGLFIIFIFHIEIYYIEYR
jgi:hypothetical protein